MAKFPTSSIHILFQAACIKAGIDSTDRKGLQKLESAIRKDIEKGPYNAEITERYLKEYLVDRTTNALNEGKAEVGFNAEYIDTLCLYLGFNSFNTFQPALEKWAKALEAREVHNTIGILYASTQEELANQRIADIIPSAFEVKRLTPQKGKDIEKFVAGTFFAFVVVDASLQVNEADIPFPYLTEDAAFPFFFYTPASKLEIDPKAGMEWRKELLVKEEDMYLLLALAAYLESRQLLHVEGLKKRKGKKGSLVHVKRIKKLVMGDNITSENYSKRDMHITVYKNSKRT